MRKNIDKKKDSKNKDMNQDIEKQDLKNQDTNESADKGKVDKRIYTMTEEKPVKAVMKMGLPLIAGMFVMAFYNLVDTYFIGKMNDDYQLAAVNLAYPVILILVAISNMIGTGASSLIARSMGAGDKDTARHTLTAGFVLTFTNSIIVAVMGHIFMNPLIKLLGASDQSFEYTKEYVSVLLIGSFFFMGSYTFCQLLRAEGSVQYSMVGMVVGTILNIILDPIFIFTLGMGVKGAALATVIGNAAGAVCSVMYYVAGKTLLVPDMKKLVPSKRILKEIFWVGVPATLETLLTTTAYIVNNNLAAGYGDQTVAAMGVSQKVITLGSYIYQGYASGLQPLMGYNYGAKNYDRMLKLMRAGIIVITGTELLVMVIFGSTAPLIISVFSESEAVIEIGAKVLRANMFILIFVGSISTARSSFQAMGKPQYAFLITVIRQLVLYIPLLLIFNHCFGFGGLIWAQPVTECIVMVLSIILLYKNIVGAREKEAIA